MAYTNTWNNNSPPGTQAANTADDELRKLRLDITERMNALVTDWLADPIVPLSSLSGAADGLYLLFGPHIFHPNSVEVASDSLVAAAVHPYHLNVHEYYQNTDAGGFDAWANIIVPVGVTITEFAAGMDINGGASASCAFYKSVITTGATAAVCPTVVRTAAGVGLATSAAFSEVTDDHTVYGIRFFCPVGDQARFYGCRIKYNRADVRSAI